MSMAVQLKARLGELIQAAELGLMVVVQRAGFFTVAWCELVRAAGEGEVWDCGKEIRQRRMSSGWVEQWWLGQSAGVSCHDDRD
ncbi:hypothetical protein M0R45_020872 [Rubus argutus]|uniref:Uncharacterized protein n=1 Tax=Rubus argutus TaxID=59490 RepID=A0AAW1XD87_RUBAR